MGVSVVGIPFCIQFRTVGSLLCRFWRGLCTYSFQMFVTRNDYRNISNTIICLVLHWLLSSHKFAASTCTTCLIRPNHFVFWYYVNSKLVHPIAFEFAFRFCISEMQPQKLELPPHKCDACLHFFSCHTEHVHVPYQEWRPQAMATDNVEWKSINQA